MSSIQVKFLAPNQQAFKCKALEWAMTQASTRVPLMRADLQFCERREAAPGDHGGDSPLNSRAFRLEVGLVGQAEVAMKQTASTRRQYWHGTPCGVSASRAISTECTQKESLRKPPE